MTFFAGGGQDGGTDALANNGLVIGFFSVPRQMNISFKAMITSFADQYSSDWEDTEAFGRMDPIQTFKRTKRQISFSFDVPAASVEEAEQNLDRLQHLIRFLYPIYDADGTMTSSPFMKIKFRNWIGEPTVFGGGGDAENTGLFGTLSGVNFEPNMELGVFSSNANKSGAEPREWGDILPKVFSVNCVFTVIHHKPFGERNEDWELFPYSVFDTALDENRHSLYRLKDEADRGWGIETVGASIPTGGAIAKMKTWDTQMDATSRAILQERSINQPRSIYGTHMTEKQANSLERFSHPGETGKQRLGRHRVRRSLQKAGKTSMFPGNE